MLKRLYLNYLSLIIDTKPKTYWKIIRFFLHWVTLPLKLILIGSIGGYQIVRQLIFDKKRKVGQFNEDNRVKYFNHILSKLPVYKKLNSMELYVNRVEYWDSPQLWNHNTDHQASRHGVYCFLMGKLDKRNSDQDAALRMHIKRNGQLLRGFKLNPYDQQLVENQTTVSGDMLVGLSLGMLNLRKEIVEEGKFLDGTTGFLKERYDEMLASIVENDYSLLEGPGGPHHEDDHFKMWQKIQEINEKLIPSEQKQIKSVKGMWQPGLETVGAQALTLLCALRVGDKIIGSAYAKKEYRKMLWKYGYGLLSLFPTTFLKNKRGYFNDHNCITALYILSKLSDSKLGKLFWKIPMVYVWLLSKTWYNAYFTGLLEDAHPGTVSKNYINECKNYLYEEQPIHYSYDGSSNVTPNEYPVKFNEMNQDEFWPDKEHELLLPPGLDDETKRLTLSGAKKYKSGLGWLAAAVMIESDPVSTFMKETV